MKRKILWLVLSLLVATALVVTSCGPAEEEEVVVEAEEEEEAVEDLWPAEEEVAEEEEAVAEEEVAEEEEVVAEEEAPGQPEYGGTLNLAWEKDKAIPQDPCIECPTNAYICFDTPMMADWRKGPSGTGENPITAADFSIKNATGALADSWEVPDPLTYIFHLRPGVTWQDKHPTWGAAVTPEDIAYHFNRVVECRWPRHDFVEPPVTTLDTDGDGETDSWVIRTNRPVAFWLYEFGHVWYTPIVPQESVEAGLENWENVSGTGPFMWTKYMPSTISEYERNDNYWDTLVVGGEEYQLPFLDKIRIVFIPEEGSRLAALRTGKIDLLGGVFLKDWDSLLGSNPELEYGRDLGGAQHVFFACDTPPLDDINVRRALNMAIDRQAIIDTLYFGEAELMGFPTSLELPSIYVPVEDCPPSVQAYFEYNPEEAERLLDLAGKPRDPGTGMRFEISMMLHGGDLNMAQNAEMMVSYYDAIGVTLILDSLEYGRLISRLFANDYEIVYHYTGARLNSLNDFKLGNQWNFSSITDPGFNDLWDDVLTETDADELVTKIKNVTRYWLDLCPGYMGPAPYTGTFWQPWLEGYAGELGLGFGDPTHRFTYVWLDRDLKEEMTGER